MKVQEHDEDLSKGIMRRGFPRPVFDTRNNTWLSKENRTFLPTPYTATTDGIAVISEHRASECLKDVLCSVCGEEVYFTDNGYITVLPKNNLLTYESGPFHPKCATLTMKFCPHIAQSDEWSVAMIPVDTWIEHQRYWFENGGMGSGIATGIDISPQPKRHSLLS